MPSTAGQAGSSCPERRLTVRASCHQHLPRPRHGRGTAASSARSRDPADRLRRGSEGGNPQGGDLPHAAALLRDATAGRRSGHPDDPGVVGPPGRLDDDDLHPRTEPGTAGGDESGGPVAGEVEGERLGGGQEGRLGVGWPFRLRRYTDLRMPGPGTTPGGRRGTARGEEFVPDAWGLCYTDPSNMAVPRYAGLSNSC